MKRIRHLTLAVGMIISALPAEGYKLPPDEILKVFDAPEEQLLAMISGTDKALEYAYERYESLESPRSIHAENSMLCWIETNDNGDPKKKVPYRDSFSMYLPKCTNVLTSS